MGRISPQEIRETEFKQSALGYSREQVNQFLDEIADELETLIRESNEIHLQHKEARLELGTYKNVEESLKETLVLAQNAAKETLTNARAEADNILRKATTEKDALLFSAKEDLAKVQADIKNLLVKREAILIKLKSLLNTNLDLLEAEFEGNPDVDQVRQQSGALDEERIIDFSKADMVVEDLPLEKEERSEDIFGDLGEPKDE